MIDLNIIKIQDILPPNLKADRQVLFVAQSLDQELLEITNAIKLCIHLPRLDELDENVVDLLAWQYHVDFYNADLSVLRKRELVRQSIAWHKRKGTPSVVEEVVKAVYGNCELQEWFEYDGKPYYFKVVVTLDEESTDKERWRGVIAAIESGKNVRSWLEKIEFYYPNIILPLKIQHRAAGTQIADAKHCTWNLGAVKFLRRDGIYYRNKLTRRNGIQPDGGYRTKQNHHAEIDVLVDSTLQNNGQVINFREGSYCRNGSHRRNGIYLEKTVLASYCTVSYRKNGVEVTESV